MNGKRLGSNFDEFLEAEGLTKAEMARRMGTSRAALERLLDPDNASVTLLTLQNAARAVGGKLEVRFSQASA